MATPGAPEDDRMAELCVMAERAWPGITVDRAELAAAIAARGDTAYTADAAVELALALACARGERPALAAFDKAYLADVPAGLAHMKLDRAMIDDLVQEVRAKLLVADDGAAAPRILEYAGQGKLRGLCQVMAARAALTRLRGTKRTTSDDGVAALAAAGDDPELAFLKAHYRDAFKTAFTAAAGELDARDRNLLRLHHLGGVTLDQLAAMYGVHRATAVRWLADVRKRLLAGTRTRLRATLSVSAEELDSIMELIGSRLDASVRRLLDSVAAKAE